MLYSSAHPASSVTAKLPPKGLDVGAIEREGCTFHASSEGMPTAWHYTTANAQRGSKPKGWVLRIAVPALPSLQTVFAAFGISRKRPVRSEGPATREELSRLFERELTDFARARPRRRR